MSVHLNHRTKLNKIWRNGSLWPLGLIRKHVMSVLNVSRLNLFTLLFYFHSGNMLFLHYLRNPLQVFGTTLENLLRVGNHSGLSNRPVPDLPSLSLLCVMTLPESCDRNLQSAISFQFLCSQPSARLFVFTSSIMITFKQFFAILKPFLKTLGCFFTMQYDPRNFFSSPSAGFAPFSET